MIKLLVNTVGADASTVEMGTGTVNSDYYIEDMISGNRARMVRSNSSGGAGNTVDFSYTSVTSTTQEVSHLVIARADKLLTKGGVTIQPQKKSSGGTWSNIESPVSLTSSDLIGRPQARRSFGQDYVQEFISSQTQHGFRLQLETDTADEALMFSKLYFSNAFDFDTHPTIKPPPKWESASGEIKPLRSTKLYEIEARINLTWEGVTRAKVNEFRNLPHILDWPLFLYDSNAYLFKFKVEHVVVLDWQETYIATDQWDIDITFGRLKHYE